MNLIFIKYNNYYNRQLKKLETLSEYYEAVGIDNILTIPDYDFNPNDGVDAEIQVGGEYYDYDNKYDYLLVSDGGEDIESRWFVIDGKRDSYGKYTLTLHRDVVADNYDDWVNADCFIEKAICPDDNKLIYNDEDSVFSQVKKQEDRLFDKTKTAWIVGYFANNVSEQTITVTADALQNTIDYDLVKNYTQSNPNKKYLYTTFSINVAKTSSSNDGYRFYFGERDGYYTNVTSGAGGNLLYSEYPRTAVNRLKVQVAADATLKGQMETLTGSSNVDLFQYNGLIAKDESNPSDIKYYRISVKEYDGDTGSNTIRETDAAGITINSLFTQNQYIGYRSGATSWAGTMPYTTYFKGQYLEFDRVYIDSIKTYIKTEASPCVDAPYKIFAMPYNEDNLRLAMQIKNTLTSNVYDIQICPYCPVQDYYTSAGVLDTSRIGTENKNWVYIDRVSGGTTSHIGYMFYVSKSNFTFNINNITTEQGDIVSIAERYQISNKKIDNQTKLYRFCSPNGYGAFDFNLAKNGLFTTINVDVTLRPSDLYIHLNPAFDGLYGKDFNDFRGLVLRGVSFSIPMTVDQWQQYVTNNVNYDKMQQRTIQNLTTQYKYQNWSTGISSALSAIGSGAMLGMLAGPTGGILGGLGSLAGGAADFFIQKKLQQNALDYNQDMFALRNQNIQALPDALVSTGCLTFNNKLVPYIEVYDATDEEIEAFAKKIAYNSMNIGIVDEPANWIHNTWSYGEITSKGYIKVKLIRCDTIKDDFHMLNSLAEELDKGVYINEYSTIN